MTELRELERLAERAWHELARVRERHPQIVPPRCAPVLFFGDLAGYRNSSVRVVTCGLNPSQREFPGDDPWLRFPAAETAYLEALSGYFTQAPLDWFGCFGEILRGLDASYGPGSAHRVLHTDICSVVPTDPTWSKLPKTVQSDLAAHGVDLWHDLIAELRPHVVLASVAYRWLDQIRFPALTPWQTLHVVQRTRPYLLEGRTLQLPDGSSTLLVRGRAANTPFGTVSNPDRFQLGSTLRRSLCPST